MSEFGEDGDAVIVAFAVAHNNLMVVEINVFDAQAHTFHEAESASIQDFSHELSYAAHVVDNLYGFGMCEDGGEAFGAGRIGEVGRKCHVYLENDPIQE